MMKKLQLVIEVEVNEEAVKEIETSDGSGFTAEQYISDLEIRESENSDSGAVEIYNENEEYYMMNIGNGRCMSTPKIISIKEI